MYFGAGGAGGGAAGATGIGSATATAARKKVVDLYKPAPKPPEPKDKNEEDYKLAMSAGQAAMNAAMKSKIPLGRAATPDELAKVILFLLSDLASYVTGHNLHVNTSTRSAVRCG